MNNYTNLCINSPLSTPKQEKSFKKYWRGEKNNLVKNNKCDILSMKKT